MKKSPTKDNLNGVLNNSCSIEDSEKLPNIPSAPVDFSSSIPRFLKPKAVKSAKHEFSGEAKLEYKAGKFNVIESCSTAGVASKNSFESQDSSFQVIKQKNYKTKQSVAEIAIALEVNILSLEEMVKYSKYLLVRGKQDSYFSYLIMQARLRDSESINKLLYLGIDISTTSLEEVSELKKYLSKFSFNPLVDAIRGGDLYAAKQMIDDGVDINSADEDGKTALHALFEISDCCSGYDFLTFRNQFGKSIFRSLVNDEQDLEKRIKIQTENRKLVKAHKMNMLQYLIENGADLWQEDFKGVTPFGYAASCYNTEYFNILVEILTQRELQKKPIVHQLIMTAKDISCIERLGELIEKGACLNIRLADGTTELHSALLHRKNTVSCALATKLLENESDPNIPCKQGIYPLHLAARRGSDALKTLLEYGAKVNVFDNAGMHPLHYLVFLTGEAGRILFYQNMKLLLEHGADINVQTQDRCGLTPLLFAMKERNIGAAFSLIKDGGADIYKTGAKGESFFSMILAISEEQFDLVKNEIKWSGLDYSKIDNKNKLLNASIAKGANEFAINLLNSGADKNFCDENNMRPIHFVLMNDNLEMLKYLIDLEVDLNVVNSRGDCLLRAALSAEAIKILLDAGLEYGAINNQEQTILHVAAKEACNEFPKLANILDGAGCDLNLRDNKGKTAFHYYIQNAGPALGALKKILEIPGLDLNIVDNYGDYPIYWCIKKQAKDFNVEQVELIFDKMSDVNIQDSNGRSLLHLAVQYQHKSLVEFLCSKEKFDINLRNNDGKTALDVASEMKFCEHITEILRNLGAVSAMDVIEIGSSSESEIDTDSFEAVISGLNEFNNPDINHGLSLQPVGECI